MTDLSDRFFNGVAKPTPSDVGKVLATDSNGAMVVTDPSGFPAPVDPPDGAVAAIVAPELAGFTTQVVADKLEPKVSARRMELHDPMLSGVSTSLLVGTHRWHLGGEVLLRGSSSQTSSATVRLSNGGATPCFIRTGAEVLAPTYSLGELRMFAASVRIFGGDALASDLTIGLRNQVGGSVVGDEEGAYFRFHGSGTNWKSVTEAASSFTQKDTGVNNNSGTTRHLAIVKTLVGYDFYVNRNLVTSHIAGEDISEAPVQVFASVEAEAGPNFQIDIQAIYTNFKRAEIFDHA